MKSSIFYPFKVIFLEKQNNDYRFKVNAADVNTFIFNTYKGNLDALTFNKEVYNPTNKANVPLFEYGKKFEATFSTNKSCDVYLTIPKIPVGFEANTPIASTPEKFKSPNWWKGNPPSDFVNQFRVVTSEDQGFQEQYDNNILYIEKDKTHANLTRTVFPNDSLYPGKIYIKLASINITNTGVNIIPYFSSPVISPTRYIRLGAMGIRNIKVYYSTISEIDAEFSAIVAEEPLKTFSGGRTEYGGGFYNDPSLFLKSIDEIRSSVENLIRQSIQKANNNYFLNYFPAQTGAALFGLPYKKNSLLIYEIILIYKESLGERIIVNKIVNKKGAAEAIVAATNAKGAEAQDLFDTEYDGERQKFVIGAIQTDQEFEGMTSKDDFLEIIGVKKEIEIDGKMKPLDIENLFEFIGFEEEGEGDAE
jgi:hypothetical protein